MCHLIPCGNDLFNLLLERRLGRKIGDAHPLPLQHRKPLRTLLHPGTRDRGEMDHEAGMARQPLAPFLAMMRRDMIADHRDRLDGRRHLSLKRGEKREKLTLTLATMALPVDTPCACVKGRKEGQGSIAPRLLRDAVGDSRLRGFRGMEAWPRLERGLFSKAEDHLIRPQGAGVERDEGPHLRIESGIAGMFRRQPPRMPPWFELRMGENTAYG